jgi:hypothetical protein
MAAWYGPGKMEEFVRDIGTLFGGLKNRFEEPSMYNAATWPENPAREWAYLDKAGLDPIYTADLGASVHHWAWAAVIGYMSLPIPNTNIAFPGRLANLTRECVQFYGDAIRDNRPWYDVYVMYNPSTRMVLPLARLHTPLENAGANADILIGSRGAIFGRRLRSWPVSATTVRIAYVNTMGDIEY